MNQLQKVFILANVAAFFVIVYLVIGFWPRWFPPKPKQERIQWTKQMDWVDRRKGLQIIAFYASPNAILPGQHVSLCYGVAQAKTVKIVPSPGDVWPTFTRCLDVAPRRSVTYTLTAEDGAGKQIQQTAEVRVLKQ